MEYTRQLLEKPPFPCLPRGGGGGDGAASLTEMGGADGGRPGAEVPASVQNHGRGEVLAVWRDPWCRLGLGCFLGRAGNWTAQAWCPSRASTSPATPASLTQLGMLPSAHETQRGRASSSVGKGTHRPVVPRLRAPGCCLHRLAGEPPGCPRITACPGGEKLACERPVSSGVAGKLCRVWGEESFDIWLTRWHWMGCDGTRTTNWNLLGLK